MSTIQRAGSRLAAVKTDSLQGKDSKFAELRCVTGNHYKVYFIWMRKIESGIYKVTAFWGKINGPLSYQTKYEGESQEKALRTFDQWKMKKSTPHGSDANYYVVHDQYPSPTHGEVMEIQVKALEEAIKGKKVVLASEGDCTYVNFLEV